MPSLGTIFLIVGLAFSALTGSVAGWKVHGWFTDAEIARKDRALEAKDLQIAKGAADLKQADANEKTLADALENERQNVAALIADGKNIQKRADQAVANAKTAIDKSQARETAILNTPPPPETADAIRKHVLDVVNAP